MQKQVTEKMLHHQKLLPLMLLLTFALNNELVEAQRGNLGLHLNDSKTSTIRKPFPRLNLPLSKFGGFETETYDSFNISCYGEGLYSHPYDCTKFFRCVDVFGNQELMSLSFKCKNGYKFSPIHRSCVPGTCSSDVLSAIAISLDHNTTQDLNHKHFATSPDFPLASDEPSTKCLSEGRIADLEDCGQYYECVLSSNGDLVAYTKSCDGMAFDNMLGNCAPLEMIKGCIPGVDKELRSTNVDDPKLKEICKANKNGFQCLDCKTLLMCADTQPHIMPCKYGNVCHNNKEGFVGGVCYPGGSSECSCNNDGTFQLDIYDESKFLLCVSKGSEPVIETCPAGLKFNKDYNSCGIPVDTSCTETGTFALKSDCTMYHSCSYTTTGWFQIVSKCPDKSMYNEIRETCEEPCNWYTNKFTCEAEGRFSNPEDCGTFYECITDPLDSTKFIQIEHECPEGFTWLPIVDRHHCVPTGSTKEKCEPQKLNSCNIPSGWCPPKKGTCSQMSCTSANEECNDNGGTTEGTCQCKSGYVRDASNNCVGTCSQMSCTSANEECDDNGGTTAGTCQCKSGYIRDASNNCVVVPAGFELYQDRIIRRTTRDDTEMTFDEAMAFCSKNFGAAPFIPRSAADWTLYREVRASLDDFMWLPATDRATEGTLRWEPTNEVVSSSDLSLMDWCRGKELSHNSESYDCLIYAHCGGPAMHMYRCNYNSRPRPPICELLLV